jgi:uncharacterized protein
LIPQTTVFCLSLLLSIETWCKNAQVFAERGTMMSRYDEIQKLQSLKDSGALTEDEFQREKQRLLNTPEPDSLGASYSTPPPPPMTNATGVGALSTTEKPWGMEVNTFCMLLHLSQLAGFAVPVLGWALPIVMWAMHKDRYPEIDTHGKIVLNWMISELIYFAICFVLVFVFIGVPLMFVLLLLGVLFPIIGGVKANDGQVWSYPGSIRFL